MATTATPNQPRRRSQQPRVSVRARESGGGHESEYDLLTAAPGNTGLFVGQPGDPRTIGVTLRMTFKSK